jgi:hypothetical protein
MALTTKVVGQSEDGAEELDADLSQLGSEGQPTVTLASDLTQVRGRLIMDYADSGDGKSTRLHSLARHYYMKTGLKVRVVTAEDSTKKVFEDLVGAGIAEVLYLDTKTPISTYERIVEGEWLTGEFEVVKVTKKVGAKEVTTERRVPKWQPKSEWEGTISAYLFEGLSTFSENILDHLREEGRFPREQSDGFTEGGRTHMAASQTAYGFVQGEGIKLLKTSGMLPVERVAWTSHESKGKEEFGAASTRGPKMVGSAGTDSIRKYVGVLLHTDRVGGEIRTYFENHPDATNDKIQWKAKVTVQPVLSQEYKKRFPKGYFVPTLPQGGSYLGAKDGLIPFLEAEDEIAKLSTDAASELVASKR